MKLTASDVQKIFDLLASHEKCMRKVKLTYVIPFIRKLAWNLKELPPPEVKIFSEESGYPVLLNKTGEKIINNEVETSTRKSQACFQNLASHRNI